MSTASETEVRSVVRVQALVRRNLCRKRYKRRVKDAKERANIAREVVKTERVYAKILSDIVNIFLNPLKESNLIKDGVITEENRRKIFPGALGTLAQVHKDFLNGLEQRVEKWAPSSMMGDLFLNMIPYFKLYPVYVSDFENQIKALKEAKNNERFWEFIKGGFKILKDPSNDLPSLLITPVQRIPRYLMLCKQLLKHTWADHRDYANLESAAAQLGKIADYVDQKAKDAENVQKMHHVQEILLGKYDTLMDPQRRFVHQGVVSVVKGREAQQMGLFLFSDIVVLAKVQVQKSKPEKAVKGKPALPVKEEIEFHYSCRYSLLQCSVADVPDSKTSRNCCQLKAPDKVYVISSDSPEQKSRLMSLLEECIQDVIQKDQALRSQQALVEEKTKTFRAAKEAAKNPAPKDAPASAAPSMAQAKRSGWLLKRTAKDNRDDKAAGAAAPAAPAVPAASAPATDSASEVVDDTQSTEEGGDDPSRKEDLSNSKRGKLGLKKATKTSAPESSAPAQPTSARGDVAVASDASAPSDPPLAVVSAKDPKDPKDANKRSLRGRTTTKQAAEVDPAPAAKIQQEKKTSTKFLGGLLGRSKDKSSKGEKPEDGRRTSAIEDGATDQLAAPSSTTPAMAKKDNPAVAHLKSDEDAMRLRRRSQVLDLDMLPTLDAGAGGDDAKLAELKAAFDRLDDVAPTADDTLGQSPRRRRSLSAPDVMVLSPERRASIASDQTMDALLLTPKAAQAYDLSSSTSKPRAASINHGAAAAAGTLSPHGLTLRAKPTSPAPPSGVKPSRALGAVKDRSNRKSMSNFIGVRSQLQAMQQISMEDLQLPAKVENSLKVRGSGAASTALESPEKSTPPVPRRAAPKLQAATPAKDVKTEQPVTPGAPAVEKLVLRRPASVVVVDSPAQGRKQPASEDPADSDEESSSSRLTESGNLPVIEEEDGPKGNSSSDDNDVGEAPAPLGNSGSRFSGVGSEKRRAHVFASTPVKDEKGNFMLQDVVDEQVSYIDENGDEMARTPDGPLRVVTQYVDEEGHPVSPPVAEMVMVSPGAGGDTPNSSFTIAPIPDNLLVDDGGDGSPAIIATPGTAKKSLDILATAAALQAQDDGSGEDHEVENQDGGDGEGRDDDDDDDVFVE